jgi:hypothetical protein
MAFGGPLSRTRCYRNSHRGLPGRTSGPPLVDTHVRPGVSHRINSNPGRSAPGIAACADFSQAGEQRVDILLR